MLDAICNVTFYATGVLPLVVFVAVLRLTRATPGHRFGAALLFALALAVGLTGTWTSILMRDGMGPGAVESEGAVAWARIWPALAWAWGVSVLLSCGGVVLAWPQPRLPRPLPPAAV